MPPSHHQLTDSLISRKWTKISFRQWPHIVGCVFQNWSVAPWFAPEQILFASTSQRSEAQSHPDLKEGPVFQSPPRYQWRGTQAENARFIPSQHPNPLRLPVPPLKRGAGPQAKGAPSKPSTSLLHSDYSGRCLPCFLKPLLLCHPFLPLCTYVGTRAGPTATHWPRGGSPGRHENGCPPAHAQGLFGKRVQCPAAPHQHCPISAPPASIFLSFFFFLPSLPSFTKEPIWGGYNQHRYKQEKRRRHVTTRWLLTGRTLLKRTPHHCFTAI